MTLLAGSCVALAQETPGAGGAPPAPPAASRDEVDRSTLRLFERFIQDAVETPTWTEFRYRYDNLEDSTGHFISPILVTRIVPRFEAGIRFGFLNVNSETQPDGSGLSDMEIFLKFVPGSNRARRWGWGGVLKIPTGDEQEGLGTGRADLELFGAWRLDAPAATLTANGAFRYTGSADTAAGETQHLFILGTGLIVPTSARTATVLEIVYETERFEGGVGESTSLTAGLQVTERRGRGGIRAAVGLPLTDGAPDLTLMGSVYFAVGAGER